MKRRYAVWGIAALLAFFAGCATLSKDQCQSGNWYEIGRKDGLAGAQLDRLNKHAEACSEHGVVPDRAAYEKGRSEALATFCQPDNGFRLGKAGASYKNVCPASMEPAFMKRYTAGVEVATLERKVRSLYDDITRLENQMDSEKDTSARQRLRERVRDLTREKDETQRRLTVIEVREGA